MEKAIILDTGFAEAYALLATYWLLRGAYNGDLDREQVLQKAEPLVNRALKLDNNSTLSHSVMASVRLWYYWDFVTVEKEYKTFTSIAPSKSEPGPFTDYLLASGRFDEALEITKKEFDHDSIAPEINNYMGLAYYFNDMQEMAIRTLDNAIFLFPEDKYLADGAIRVAVYSKNYRRTLEIFENIYHDYHVQDIKPNLLGFVGIAYLKSGDLSRSASFLNELLAKSRNSPIGSPSFYAAITYSVMGEKDKAIKSLEKAFNDHEIEMYWLKVEPLFKPLHGDPRFENILKKIGFK
jgi:tetratricopeptide (TPR) repeat protein